MSKRVKDLSGMKVGMLTVIKQSGADAAGRAIWECVCDCGNVVNRQSQILTRAHKKGKKSHCGCSPYLKSHGLTKTNQRLYWVWAAMIQRCENSSNKDYPNYGGRGIVVCKEWRNSFEEFWKWASESGYREGMTIERIDVDEGYHPDNCTWIENKRQALNTTRSNIIEFKGESKHVSDWARHVGINVRTIKTRLRKGWSIERALTEKPYIGKNQIR